VQHSKNPFRSFLTRNVLGFGTRINIDDSTKMGFGVLTEDEEDLQGNESDTERLSIYFTDKYELAENIDLLLTAYYQPSLDETDDYKASILTGVNFTVNENVSISLQFSSFYDSIPPEFADKQDEQISTEFSYSF
jgi:putative salt-induced outer membrane protein YdiY